MHLLTVTGVAIAFNKLEGSIWLAFVEQVPLKWGDKLTTHESTCPESLSCQPFFTLIITMAVPPGPPPGRPTNGTRPPGPPPGLATLPYNQQIWT